MKKILLIALATTFLASRAYDLALIGRDTGLKGGDVATGGFGSGALTQDGKTNTASANTSLKKGVA